MKFEVLFFKVLFQNHLLRTLVTQLEILAADNKDTDEKKITF